MDGHRCKYEPIGSNRIVCNGCDTVTDIATLLKNNTAAVQRDTRVQILSAQLFARELKKDAHIAAYQWVINNAPSALRKQTEEMQGVLL